MENVKTEDKCDETKIYHQFRNLIPNDSYTYLSSEEKVGKKK